MKGLISFKNSKRETTIKYEKAKELLLLGSEFEVVYSVKNGTLEISRINLDAIGKKGIIEGSEMKLPVHLGENDSFYVRVNIGAVLLALQDLIEKN